MSRDPKTERKFTDVSSDGDDWAPPRLSTREVPVLSQKELARAMTETPVEDKPSSTWKGKQEFAPKLRALVEPLSTLQGFEALFLLRLDAREQSVVTGNAQAVDQDLLEALTSVLSYSDVHYVCVSRRHIDLLLHTVQGDRNVVCVLVLNRTQSNFALAKMKLTSICAA